MNPAELVQVCSAGVFSCVPPAVRNRLLENSCLGFTTVGGTRENFCVGLVTSSCLIRFDAHSEQIDLSLDKIKVLKPFPPNCFNLAPYVGVLCYAELSSFLFKNIFTDWDGWGRLLTITIETAGNFMGFLVKWAWELFWDSLQVTCMSAKHVCKQAVSSCVCAQLCLTVCDPMDCSPPGSSVHGILQARILEWVVISSSRRSSWLRDKTRVSCIGKWILYHCIGRQILYLSSPIHNSH